MRRREGMSSSAPVGSGLGLAIRVKAQGVETGVERVGVGTAGADRLKGSAMTAQGSR